MQNSASDEYSSLPLEDNIFEWQFAIRGPRDTEFEGGIYHGRIQLPPEYPFKPPAFMLLTPNGRFETQTKICLSISQYHPEHWQPSWSVRTALVALIAFMPTKPDGAIGSLDYTKEERRALAIKSRAEAPKFGNEERQKVINEIHEIMLKKAPPVPVAPPKPVACDDVGTQDAKSGLEDVILPDVVQPSEGSSVIERENESENVHDVQDLQVEETTGLPSVVPSNQENSTNAAVVASQQADHHVAPARRPVARHQPADDRLLTLLAIGLTMALVAILVKKIMKSAWWLDSGSI